MGKGIVKLGEGNWAVKDGNLLAAKETNGRFKNAEFTVTRGSDATYVGRDGLIKRFLTGSETELITNSDFSTSGDVTTSSFDLGWKLSVSDNLGVSIVNNQLLLSRPVGENTDYGRVYATNGVDSINVKPANHEGRRYKLEFEIVAKTGTPTLRWYNNGYITFTDTTLGKKTIYFTSSTNRLVVFLQEHEGSSITLDNISLIDVEDIDDTPRIDFTDNTDGHLLLEPQSTNLIPYSEDFSDSSWAKTNCTINSNNSISPEGTQNATTITASGSGVLNHIISSDDFTIASGDITASIFAKKGTVDYLRLRFDGTTSNERAWYNLNNGTIDGEDSSGSAKIEDFGNGWYRCILTSSNNTASGNCGLQVFVQDLGGTQTSWEADGTENIHIWGGQVEELEYPTSYIPTNGLQVTRDAETCTGAGETADFNSEEGVLYAEIAAFANDGTVRYLSLTDGTSNNRVLILYYSSANNIRTIITSGGTDYMDKNYGVTSVLDFHKVAIRWKANDFSLWVDGSERKTDTSGSVPIGLNSLSFDSGTGSSNFYGKCKAIRVYKETDGIDLATLTSQ